MSSSAEQVVLEARGLKAGYDGVPVVHGVDFVVGAGEIVAMLGANGAGKTTTVLTLAGELAPIDGEVTLFGVPVHGPLHRRVRAGLGLVTEDRCVFMSMTVHENLRVNRGDIGFAMELFPELAPHVHRRVGLLSGGQQQMLSLARALARRPKLLLADELSFGLAPQLIDRLLRALRDAADEGLGVLLIEQHIHKALAIADRAYILRRGQIELSGTGADLRHRADEIVHSYLTSSSDTDATGLTIVGQRAEP